MSEKEGSYQREKKPHELNICGEDGKSREETISRLALMPSVKAMGAIREYSSSFGGMDITELCDALKASATRVNSNDLSEVEAHLMAQAQTLDSIFYNLASRARRTEHMDLLKNYLTLALKAQNQSRMTFETLAAVKNPQPYVRQQNVAVNQQVNNAAQPPQTVNAPAPEGNSKLTNELLEDRSHEYERLDTGAPQATGRAYQDVEAMAEINGRKDD